MSTRATVIALLIAGGLGVMLGAANPRRQTLDGLTITDGDKWVKIDPGQIKIGNKDGAIINLTAINKWPNALLAVPAKYSAKGGHNAVVIGAGEETAAIILLRDGDAAKQMMFP